MMVKFTRKARGHLVSLIEVDMHLLSAYLDVTPGQRNHTLCLYACHIPPPFCFFFPNKQLITIVIMIEKGPDRERGSALSTKALQ